MSTPETGEAPLAVYRKSTTKPRPAPIVNERLAALLGDQPNPVERFAVNQGRARTLWETDAASLLKHGRPVVLECGHVTITKALERAKCPRCGEMIRSGWDYDAFRRCGALDSFKWPDDPLRLVNEVEEN